VFTTGVQSIPSLVQFAEKVVKIAAGWQSACITEKGELCIWEISEQPMKSLTVTENVVDLSVGRTVAAAVDSKGMIWSWGTNEIGELGLGDSENRLHPSPMLALKSRKVTQVACGGNFAISLGQKASHKLSRTAS